jgi:hypothetical protein
MDKFEELRKKLPVKHDLPPHDGPREEHLEAQREMLREFEKERAKSLAEKPLVISGNKVKIPTIQDGEINADQMAEYVMSFNTYATILESKEGEMLHYDNGTGLYEPYGDKQIAALSEAYLSGMGMAADVTNNYITQIVGHVARHTYISSEKLNQDMDILVLKNGVLKISTRELLPFDKKYYATISLPVIYDPTATCPNIEKFIQSLVETENIDILFELFAWCLIRNSEIQRFILLLGEGQDGKSKYIALLKAFLGALNCSYYTLQQLTLNTFAASGLIGKLANLVADLPSRALSDVGIIKALTKYRSRKSTGTLSICLTGQK